MKTIIILLSALLVSAYGSSCSTLKTAPKIDTTPLSIAQGVSGPNSAQFAILLPQEKKYSYTVQSKDLSQKPIVGLKKSFQRSFSKWKVDQIKFKGLKIGKKYTLKVISENQIVIDERSFQTLNIKKRKSKFALVSCMDDSLEKRQKIMWNSLMKSKPEMMFFIGDNVYVDKNFGYMSIPHKKYLWERYVITRNRLQIFRSKELVPIFSVWDDHDYGKNNGDRNFEFKKEAQLVMNAFFPREEVSGIYSKGPGVSSHLKAFNQNFIFLDNRSFRSPHKNKNMKQTHWGAEQEQWVYNIVEKSKNPTWLIQGDQFFGAYHRFESYEGQRPKSFTKMLSHISNSKSPVIFASGDRHCTEIMEIEKNLLGYRTYELTSSGIHAKHFPGQWEGDSKNPRQIAGEDTEDNYMIINSEADSDHLKIDLTAFGPQNKILFKKSLKVQKSKETNETYNYRDQ